MQSSHHQASLSDIDFYDWEKSASIYKTHHQHARYVPSAVARFAILKCVGGKMLFFKTTVSPRSLLSHPSHELNSN